MRMTQPEVVKVTIVPPMTCRKVVFDNGKTQAGEYWPLLDHNAADSLALDYMVSCVHPCGQKIQMEVSVIPVMYLIKRKNVK